MDMLSVTAQKDSRPQPALRRISVEFDVPEELFHTFHGEKGVARRIRERIALDLLDAELISRGRAADMLALDPAALVDLLQRRDASYFTGSDDEFARDLETSRSALANPAL